MVGVITSAAPSVVSNPDGAIEEEKSFQGLSYPKTLSG